MPITFLDLIFIVLVMIWTMYRLYFAHELYKNIVADVYSKHENAVTIILLEGLIYLVVVFILFPFGKQSSGWNYIIWYVSLILFIWCFVHIIKYFHWRKNKKLEGE